MKITLIGPAFPYRGGISHFNSEMARTFREKSGFEVQVVNFQRLYPGFIFPGKTQFDESETAFQVPSDRVIDVCNPFSWLAALRKIAAFQPDIVFFQWWTPLMALPYLTIAGGLKNMRLAAIMHNIAPHESLPFSKGLLKAFVQRIHQPVVMSRSARTKLLNNFSEEEQKKMDVLTLFHPLYDCFHRVTSAGKGMVEKACEDAGYTVEELKTKRVVLFFGLIRKYKGLKQLIRAVPLLEHTEEIVLLVAGEFYDKKSEYIELIKELELENRVLLLDRYIPNSEVGFVMNLADILVCPYESGEQSGVIAAALANGLPVITMDGKGIGEIIEDGVTGLLLENNSENNIAAKIEKFYELSENTDFKGNIKAKTSRYSWSNFITKIVEGIHDE